MATREQLEALVAHAKEKVDKMNFSGVGHLSTVDNFGRSVNIMGKVSMCYKWLIRME